MPMKLIKRGIYFSNHVIALNHTSVYYFYLTAKPVLHVLVLAHKGLQQKYINIEVKWE